METANRLHAELVETPALFDEYILEYSEDPAAVSNGGNYPRVVRGQMVKPFEEKAFSMEQEGSISEPVKTAYGYHIIRLNNRMPPEPIPFEQIKPTLVQKAYEKHMETYQRNYVLRVSDMPITLEEGAVEIMVKRHFGENLELAPDFDKQ